MPYVMLSMQCLNADNIPVRVLKDCTAILAPSLTVMLKMSLVVDDIMYRT